VRFLVTDGAFLKSLMKQKLWQVFWRYSCFEKKISGWATALVFCEPPVPCLIFFFGTKKQNLKLVLESPSRQAGKCSLRLWMLRDGPYIDSRNRVACASFSPPCVCFLCVCSYVFASLQEADGALGNCSSRKHQVIKWKATYGFLRRSLKQAYVIQWYAWLTLLFPNTICR